MLNAFQEPRKKAEVESMPGTSPSYSFTIRIKAENSTGMIGNITSVIGDAGGDIGGIDIVKVQKDSVIRDYTVNASDVKHSAEIVKALEKLDGANVINISDRTFLIHLGGKISITNKIPLNTRDDLSMAYTPGVARVCTTIAEDKSKAYQLTIKGNTIAIVTDGSAVLGLGDIGPEASMPVMEGKAMLFKKFAGVNAFPISLNTKDVDEIVDTVVRISPAFGGINLEDISSPRCFEIERKLRERLDMPIFHDDQHGTAIVVLAGIINALKLTGRELKNQRIVICGTGAAGIACARLLMKAGATNILGLDSTGILYRGRKENMCGIKTEFADETNPNNEKGSLADAMRGADIFIGVSSPNIVDVDMIKSMNKDPIVFALSNPVPEIDPTIAEPHVKIMASGRSDYQNQINNVLCFPGFFKGLLNCHAKSINTEMELAAAEAIASVIKPAELHEDYIIPSVFDKRVVDMVEKAVVNAAYATGIAKRRAKEQEY
ncbi:MAG: NAD-dependent malic enzyme [Proteobacteria bacterium]|nr:NAD-dependent malic enzyme [Pseudomonadota bacterium]